MGILVAIIAYIPCTILYLRMYRRETPAPMPKKNALIPAAFGIVSPFFSTLLVMGFGLLLLVAGVGAVSDHIHDPVLLSLVSSFLKAGFSEEIIKCLLILLAVRITKPKNVYEYMLSAIGVGYGFTITEEMLYGQGGLGVTLMRVPCFAMHMVLGLVMGYFFALARREKQTGGSLAGRYRVLGFCLPVLWHTIYDAATVSNAGLKLESDAMVFGSIVVALLVIIATCILQFWLLVQYKKKTQELCEMELN